MSATRWRMQRGESQASASRATCLRVSRQLCRTHCAESRSGVCSSKQLSRGVSQAAEMNSGFAERALATHPRHAESQQDHRSSRPLYQQAIDSEGQSVKKKRRILQAAAAFALVPALGALQHPAAAAAAGSATSTSASCDLQTSSSGLQWCDLAVGEGAYPIKGAFTKAHYSAKLAANGAQFDSSYQRRQPLIFKVGEREVIEAWDVAILGTEDIPPMREGGKRLVVAPPGPLQKQGTKSLVWVVGLSEAIEDAGLELSPEGAPTSPLVFELELLRKKASRG